MKKHIILALLLTSFLASGCSSQSDANRALKGAGYTNIKTDGYDFFACGGDDFFHTKFTANNPVGNKVSGTVCSGLLFKSATIRF